MVRSTHSVNRGFRFWVEFGGLVDSGFSEVSGLHSEIDIEEYREGGVNGYVHRLAKATKFHPIVLKRGITKSPDLWNWYEAVMGGYIARMDGAIIMHDEADNEIVRWNIFGCYPVKWIGPEMNATSSSVAIESIELVHNGFKAVFKQ
ncbi:MAG: phage tail protein [Paenibacillaceae bacterium]